MLQPNNGIFIATWYDDPHDTALFMLTPLLEELVQTRARVPDILDKYRDQIPIWAGFDQFGGDFSEDFEPDGGYGGPAPLPVQQEQQFSQVERPLPQQDLQPPARSEVRQPAVASMYAQPPDKFASPYSQQLQTQPQPAPQPQHEAPSHQMLAGGYPQTQAPIQAQGQYLQPRGGYAQAAPAAPQRSAPARSEQPQAKAAPTFSKVSGAYQAPPPQQQPQQQQQPAQQPQSAQMMAQGARPAASAAIWGRPGLGAHQYVPHR